MSYIFDLLHDISNDIHVRRTISAKPDALIATGSDETVRTLRGLYPDVRALFRGTRSSIAVLSGCETEAELRLLADDIFTYNGLGCRNVSLLFVPEGFDMQHVARMFEAYGPVHPAYRNNYLQNRALAMMESPQEVVDGGFFLLAPGDDFPLYISRINYITYTGLGAVDSWVAVQDEKLQCIVSGSYRHPAVVPFGRAQFPGLADYADRRDAVRFLCNF